MSIVYKPAAPIADTWPQTAASLSIGGRSLCRASLLFRVRGRVRVLGLGFCVRVRVRVSITGNVVI